MTNSWAFPIVVVFAGCGVEPTAPEQTTRAQETKWARPLCIPISVSGAFDAASQRSQWRDAEVQALKQTVVSPGVEITRELDWDGQTSVYTWDAPGEQDDFSVYLTWQWFSGLQRTLPLSMQRTYRLDQTRNYSDTFSYDENGRLYRFNHDYTDSDVDDRTETFTYDWDGQLVQVSIQRGDPMLSHTYDITWDRFGRIARWGEDYKGHDDYLHEDFVYNDDGLLRDWSRQIPNVVQEHVSVAWTPELQPIVVDSRGTFGRPLIKACP